MTETRRLAGMVPVWAGLVSAIALARLLTSPSLTPLDYALIFSVSILSGLALGELENVIIGFLATLVLSILIIGLVLILPAILGLAGPVYDTVAETDAATGVFKALFPYTLILVMTGGIVGGVFSERLGFG
jgi:hypothetical protein